MSCGRQRRSMKLCDDTKYVTAVEINCMHHTNGYVIDMNDSLCNQKIVVQPKFQVEISVQNNSTKTRATPCVPLKKQKASR